MEDHLLLREFAEAGSEPAFRKLVERHIDLVYSTARRRLGDPHQAKDVAQQVFVLLARKASRLSPQVILSGWLYRTTCHLASETIRRETRRQQRDQLAAAAMNPDTSDSTWREIEPLLDEAMAGLGETDRDAVVLRYYENKSLREVGAALRVSDDAAQKRLSRAVEKLRAFFAAHHKPITGSALTAAMASGTVQSAPSGLATVLSAAAISSAVVTTSTLTSLMSWTTLKPIVTSVAALAAGTALVVQTSQLNTQRRSNETLLSRAQNAERNATAAQEELAKAVHAAENDARISELARLRAELTGLRRDQAALSAENTRLKEALTEAGHALEQVTKAQHPESDPARDAIKQLGIAKMNYAKQWCLAFFLFAQEHDGRMPATFEEAGAFFGGHSPGDSPSTVADARTLSFAVTTQVGDVSNVTVLSPSQFEIMYQGLIAEVPNPATTIVMREKEPFAVPGRSGLSRTYGFADGHCEIHRAADGDFTAWEQARLAPSTR